MIFNFDIPRSRVRFWSNIVFVFIDPPHPIARMLCVSYNCYSPWSFGKHRMLILYTKDTLNGRAASVDEVRLQPRRVNLLVYDIYNKMRQLSSTNPYASQHLIAHIYIYYAVICQNRSQVINGVSEMRKRVSEYALNSIGNVYVDCATYQTSDQQASIAGINVHMLCWGGGGLLLLFKNDAPDFGSSHCLLWTARLYMCVFECEDRGVKIAISIAGKYQEPAMLYSVRQWLGRSDMGLSSSAAHSTMRYFVNLCVDTIYTYICEPKVRESSWHYTKHQAEFATRNEHCFTVWGFYANSLSGWIE